jgi:hypothetical protein
MNAKELKAKAAAEILMFEKLSKLTAISMVKMLMSQENKIAELEKALQRQTKRVKLLEPLLESEPNSQDIRDLEQQAKSINDAVETCEKHHADNLGEEVITVIDLLGYRLGLEYQAKALKEGK